MAQQDRNGSRNVAVPDESRPSWRPTDEAGRRNRRNLSEEDERYRRDREEDDRYMQRDRFMHWDERHTRWDRDDDYRYDDDRARGRRDVTGYGRGYGYDDRSGERYGYGGNEGRGGYLGQGGQQMDDEGDEGWGNEGYMARRGQHQEGGMYGHGPGSWGQPRRGRNDGRPSYRGKGPAGYTRSDERIREAVCEALTDDHDVDATHIDVTVRSGEVILSGTVADRRQKRLAEDCAEQVAGVKDVQNQIRIATDKDIAEDGGNDKRHRA